MTKDEIKKALRYDADTGVLYWNESRGRSRKDAIAGYLRSDGYVYVTFKFKHYLAHRLAWLLYYGSWPKQQVDHIDGNRSNNAIANLRDVDPCGNQHNQHKVRSASGFMGVSRDGNGWMAKIMYKGRNTYLGTYPTPEEASAVYQAAKAKRDTAHMAREGTS